MLFRSVSLAAQTVLDEVLLRFGGDIVTRLDVRQARLLNLVDPPADTDQAYAETIANRRLMLSEVRRSSPPEPAADAIDAKFREWSARAGGGNVTDLLARAGMPETGMRAWLRDDLRLQQYLEGRFGSRTADQAAWVATLRQRAGLK